MCQTRVTLSEAGVALILLEQQERNACDRVARCRRRVREAEQALAEAEAELRRVSADVQTIARSVRTLR